LLIKLVPVSGCPASDGASALDLSASGPAGDEATAAARPGPARRRDRGQIRSTPARRSFHLLPKSFVFIMYCIRDCFELMIIASRVDLFG